MKGEWRIPANELDLGLKKKEESVLTPRLGWWVVLLFIEKGKGKEDYTCFGDNQIDLGSTNV